MRLRRTRVAEAAEDVEERAGGGESELRAGLWEPGNGQLPPLDLGRVQPVERLLEPWGGPWHPPRVMMEKRSHGHMIAKLYEPAVGCEATPKTQNTDTQHTYNTLVTHARARARALYARKYEHKGRRLTRVRLTAEDIEIIAQQSEAMLSYARRDVPLRHRGKVCPRE